MAEPRRSILSSRAVGGMEVKEAGSGSPEAMVEDEWEGVFLAVVGARAGSTRRASTCLGDVLCNVDCVLQDVFHSLARNAFTVSWGTWRTPSEMPL